MKYEIIADMSVDMDIKAAEKFNIKYIPMDFIVGGETVTASAPWDAAMMHDYYDRLRNKEETGTSQITPGMYEDAFEPYVRDGIPVLYVCLSSGLSSTYESAVHAVDMMKEKYGEKADIEVVDSLGATGGMGLLCEAAGLNREHGMGLKENAAWLRKAASYIGYWVMVEDLMYLKRGGRISGATAVVGTALNIKPILMINGEGRLETISKKRGSKLAMKYLAELYKENTGSSIEELCTDEYFKDTTDKEYIKDIVNTIYICCADRLEDAKELKSIAESINPDAKVKLTLLSPVIGAHTGPDIIALIHFGKYKQKK